MIRVLQMIGGLEMGGSQTFIMNIYRVIDRTKIQFDFVVDRDESGVFDDEIGKLGGKIFHLPKFSGKGIAVVRRAWDAFLTEHPEYHILHSHVRSYASLYIPIAKRHGLITIIHSHSTSNGSGIQALGKMVLQYPLRFEADYFFACSREAGEWLFGKRIVEGTRYYTFPNGIDCEKFRFDPAVRAAVRRELGIPPEAVVYGHVGRMHESKNHMFLLDVFQAIRAEQPKAFLLLVGDGPLWQEIEEKIVNAGLQAAVCLAGMRTDPERMLQAMDCFVFPSKYEGLGIAIIEAQAAGLPCLVSDSVPADAGLTEQVRFLPIDAGWEIWKDAALNTAQQRKDVEDAIKAAGYDVRKSAKRIEEFYKSISSAS